MVLAFVVYKTQLTDRYINLIEQVIQFKMMRLHLDRIADIALTKQEANRDGSGGCFDRRSEKAQGKLVLENICFSYDDTQKLLLNNVNLILDAGACVAITSAAGSGKTTLMKIMLGLLKPTSGRVLLDGQDITQIGLKHYRKQVAAVMQDDTLLSGSIGDNISFFSPQPDQKKVKQCAKLAAVDSDIMAMTMGYSSLVGDMGANLSGGQIQRVLLARGLYQSPCVLFMDEATSHLDQKNEAKISQQIGNLPMTRILIAHRQETIATAQRCHQLYNGLLTKQTNSMATRCPG